VLKNTYGFIKEYLHFSLVLLATIVAVILAIIGKSNVSNIILAVTALISTIPILWDIYQSLRHGEYGVDILAATAIITSVLLGEVWAGIVIVIMLTGGEALEDYAEKRAKTELTSLLERAPTKAHVLRGRKVVDVSVKKVSVGDKVLVKPGEVVPVDGLIIEGSSSFDESSITGEPLPVDKIEGEQILSGAINQDSAITIKAIHTADDSQYGQIIKLVRAASASQSPFVRLADRYSIPFTIIAFAIAGAAWALSGEVIRFLEVLVVATPCPLILGAPIAIISGMSRAAKQGIIIKTGGALERLAGAKTMAFDKTGTLTKGRPVVDSILTFNKTSKSEILELAAALEQNSNHILAKAIVEKAKKDGLKIPKLKGVKEVTGLGLKATFKSQEVLVGKLSFMEKEGITTGRKVPANVKLQTSAYIAKNGELVGVITFNDEVRSETKSTIARLKEMGIKHLFMVTGDNETTANAIGKKLGIEDVKAECLPADKLIAMENIKDRPVAFVGDGVNDAPVLTASDVGVALGARGSTAASESADIVVMLDDFSKVADSVEISKRTLFIAKQSILIGIFISIGLMFIFATGKFKPVYGAAIQEVVDVAVIINALRAHGSWSKSKS
jgi:heavy metal translocating P-type ATPase